MFQGDGTLPHTVNVTMAWLREKFGKRLLSLKAEVEWAPHSPDLNLQISSSRSSSRTTSTRKTLQYCCIENSYH